MKVKSVEGSTIIEDKGSGPKYSEHTWLIRGEHEEGLYLCVDSYKSYISKKKDEVARRSKGYFLGKCRQLPPPQSPPARITQRHQELPHFDMFRFPCRHISLLSAVSQTESHRE